MCKFSYNTVLRANDRTIAQHRNGKCGGDLSSTPSLTFRGTISACGKNTHTLFPSRRSTVLIGKQSKLHMARNYSLFPLRFSDHQYTFTIGGNGNAAITENTITQDNNITDENN